MTTDPRKENQWERKTK